MPRALTNHLSQRLLNPRTSEKTECWDGGFLRRVGLEENVLFLVSAMPGEMSAGPVVTE
jgi:hypothetical protein